MLYPKFTALTAKNLKKPDLILCIQHIRTNYQPFLDSLFSPLIIHRTQNHLKAHKQIYILTPPPMHDKKKSFSVRLITCHVTQAERMLCSSQLLHFYTLSLFVRLT